MKKIKVWDLPTRLFHWLLVISMAITMILIHIDGLWIDWHARLGYLILALMTFRWLWGYWGSQYARFSQFLKSPQETYQYIQQKDPATKPGHNPLGAWSVMALLLSITIQALTGLFMTDEIAFNGPLYAYVSSIWVDYFIWVHHQNQYVLMSLIALHLGAIFYYQVIRKKDLIGPMRHGYQEVDERHLAADDHWRLRSRALIIFLMSALVYFYFFL